MLSCLLHELRLFFLALQFFTRVPIPAWVGYEPAWMHASARYYPAVGLVAGAWGALVGGLAAQLWPLPVAVGLSMAATVWMTGGFHEDGLADTCDGLGGTVSRERALTIMKDSRLGTYGALGLVGVLGLKAAALYGLAVNGPATLVLLVWAHAVSRVVPVVLLRALPYAGDLEHAKAKPMAQQVSTAGLVAVLLWALGCTALAAWALADPRWLVGALLGLVGMALWCGRWFWRRLGGYTGDTLGASQQLCELAAYLGALAMLRWP